MNKRAWLFALSLLLALPAAAQVTRGYASIGLNLRAGPDIGYPTVDLIPTGTPLFVHGCTVNWTWCDVSLYDENGWDERGWVAGDFIDYPYRGQWVSPYTYGAVIGIPIVSFVIGDYWFHHYRHHRFYRDRDYWYHRRFADHDVPRYRHERRHLADGFRDRGRYDRDRYDRDGYRRYHRDADTRYRNPNRVDVRVHVRGRHIDRRMDRREEHRVNRQVDHRRRLAPTVARQIGPRNERTLAHAPRRNLHPQRMARYQPRPDNHTLARNMVVRSHAARPARTPVQHRANRQHVRHGNRHNNRHQHD